MHELLARVRRRDYSAWLAHVAPAAACSHPVRLRLDAEWHHDARLPEVYRVSNEVPDGLFYIACKNRRASVCPSCAETYRADTYQLVKAGLVGGKGVPDSVVEHPTFFLTLTAPGFGPVHSRVESGGKVRPCRVRRQVQVCEHGKLMTCHLRHTPDAAVLGEPMCRDCYDYEHQAVWNFHIGELWRRTSIAFSRGLARAGRIRGTKVRLSYAKVAEYQRRGVVHFHALIRIDGYDPECPDAILAPDASITPELIRSHLADAITGTAFTTEAHPRNQAGWPIAWGGQFDIRTVRLAPADCDDHGTLTTTAVAAYLAKYATKATEEAGHVSRRLTEASVQLRTEEDSHQARQLQACWSLGRRPFYLTSKAQREEWVTGWGRLQRWAHMLGYGGHFSTKSRRYSTTLGALRAVRRAYQLGEPIEPPAEVAPLDADADGTDAAVTLNWIFDGTGWLTSGDAALANTSAALARARRQAGREELEHQLAA